MIKRRAAVEHRSDLIMRLARAAADYYLIVSLLQEHYEEARDDPEACHERAFAIAISRSRAKGRKVTRKELNLAIKTIREHTTN